MKAIQKISTLLLAAIFLFFSLGFSINKMVCFKSGKTKISLASIKDCCSKEHTNKPVLKSNCCDISTTAFHLNDYDPSQENTIPTAVNYILPLNSQITAVTHCQACCMNLFSAANLPPPLYGKQLLSFISVLII